MCNRRHGDLNLSQTTRIESFVSTFAVVGMQWYCCLEKSDVLTAWSPDVRLSLLLKYFVWLHNVRASSNCSLSSRGIHTHNTHRIGGNEHVTSRNSPTKPTAQPPRLNALLPVDQTWLGLIRAKAKEFITCLTCEQLPGLFSLLDLLISARVWVMTSDARCSDVVVLIWRRLQSSDDLCVCLFVCVMFIWFTPFSIAHRWVVLAPKQESNNLQLKFVKKSVGDVIIMSSISVTCVEHYTLCGA